MKMWEFAVIASVTGIVGFMGLVIDKKSDQIDRLTKAAGVCKEAIRLREATKSPRCDCSDAERGRENALARLGECDGRLGELIGHKCDPCKARIYAETLKHEPHIMFGPARFICPPEAPVVWLDPDYGIGGDWAYICTPEKS